MGLHPQYVYDVASDDQSTELRSGPIARVRLDFEQPRFLGRPSLRELSTVGVTRTLEQTYDDLGAQLGNGVVWQPRASLTLFTAYHLQGDFVQGPPGASVLTAPLTLGCQTTTDSCIVWLSYVEQTLTWDRPRQRPRAAQRRLREPLAAGGRRSARR